MMEESENPMNATNRNDDLVSSSFRKGSPAVGKNSIYGLTFHSVSHEDIESNISNIDDNDQVEIDLNNNDFSQKSDNSTTGIRIHNDNSNAAVQEYSFGRMNSMKRYVKRCSLQRPRMYGVFLTSLTCVLPLIITVIVLGSLLQDKIHHKKNKKTVLETATVTSDWGAFAITSNIAAVAADDFRCSTIGKGILAIGGNAVDGAVATALCLGVVSPASSGIGGGCYILTHNHTTHTNEFLDSREYAPSGATNNMFVKSPIDAQDGGLAVAVFSELKGLHQIWQEHGQLEWAQLVTPAAVLAENWVIDREVASLIITVKSQLYSGLYPLLSGLYLNSDGNMKTIGDTVQQPLLAQTLRNIAQYGPDYLYDTMASTLASEIQAAGGIVSTEDIKLYVPIKHNAINTTFLGHTYIGVSGSSSGGPAVAGILSFMGSYPDPIASMGGLYFHRLAQAMNHVFAIRLSLGDPAFVNTTGPVAALLSPSYMSFLRAMTPDDSVLPLSSYGGKHHSEFSLKTDHGTTHLSVIDKWGNAVAITSTVNTYFGSKVISPSTGILFNNQMDDFSVPGVPNFFGLAPSPLNYPEKYKRPLSSMSPSFVLDRKGDIRLVGGGSGGPKIITATAQTILNSIGHGMDILSAVRSPRIHCQLIPPEVHLENHTLINGLKISMDESVYHLLHSIGHNVTSDAVVGYTQFISVDSLTGVIEAVSDPRKDGKPSGMR